MNLKISKEEIKKLIKKNFGVQYVLINKRDERKLKIYKDRKWKTIQLPKKKAITEEYIMERVSKVLDSNYENLRSVFSKLDLKTGKIYFTSFGFSYMCALRKREEFNKDIKKLQEKLDKLGIKYKNEFSDAGWVYRFKISKKRDNIERIRKIGRNL